MSQKAQPTAGAGLNNEEFSFLDHYVNPDWTTVVDPVQNAGEANFFAGLPDFSKDPIFMEPLPFDLGLYMNSDGPSISTKDIFTPVAAQPTVGTSVNPAATTFELSLGAFSDSASPADSHSPSRSASANADDLHTDSEEDSDDPEEDDFKAPKRGSTSKGRAASASVKNKRAANKPKPYPRVSDVVRDAPHKLGADGKRLPASTELKGSVRTGDGGDDDWRPTMEEYQKMSSKEKRQLRNKISARNFRVRRKEYITTLEGEVAVRDQQLETYREELTSTRSENSELKKEIERLRQEIMEGRGGASIFDQPSTESKVGILAQTNGKATRSKVVVRANRNKDLPSSGSTRGFWGGSTMGGATSVHTTLIPEFDISTLSGKPRLLQENMNPLLNSNNVNDESYTHANMNANLPLLSSGLDGLHNFTFKGLDGDRMQLWSRMAREAGAAQAQREKLVESPASSTNSSSGSSVYSSSFLSSANVGPLFFTTPAGQIVKKEVSKAVSTMSPTPAQAVLATSISQNISGKLMGALWGAFAPKSTLDMDKVKSVLEGKAELRVVDVESSSAAALEEGLKAMSLAGAAGVSASRKGSVETLEDSLKGMSLSPSSAARKELTPRKECSPTSAVGIFARPMRAGHSPTPAHQPTSKHVVTAQH